MQTVIEQLPSRHFLKDGHYYIEYGFKVNSNHHYLTDLKILWEDVFGGDVKVNLSHDQKHATFCEASNNRAVKYSSEYLNFLFRDLLVLGFVVPNKTPEKYRVESY